jgi:hypothetical protein
MTLSSHEVVYEAMSLINQNWTGDGRECDFISVVHSCIVLGYWTVILVLDSRLNNMWKMKVGDAALVAPCCIPRLVRPPDAILCTYKVDRIRLYTLPSSYFLVYSVSMPRATYTSTI